MPVRGEAPALAPVALGADAHADLVQPVRLRSYRDEPTPAAPVGAEDIVAAELEDAEAAQDVLGDVLGGGAGRQCARLCLDQEMLLLVRASGVWENPPGPFLLTPTLSQVCIAGSRVFGYHF